MSVLGADQGVVPTDAKGIPLNLDFETGTLKDWHAEGNAFAGMPVEARRSMGERAQADVKRYGVPEFVAGWSRLYAEAGSNAG